VTFVQFHSIVSSIAYDRTLKNKSLFHCFNDRLLN